MPSTFELKPSARRLLVGRQLWAICLALCPISYLAVLLIRYSPFAGGLAAFFVLVSLTEVVVERERQPRFPGIQAWASGLGAAVGVGAAAYFVGRVGGGIATLFSLAVVLEIGFLWICVPLLRRDLRDREFFPGACGREEAGGTEAGSFRAALSFVFFFSLLVLGAGALWSKGEVWAPNPTAWVLALMALTLGAMLLERLGFLEHSARHGNLAMPRHSHRRWIASAALVFLLAALLATAGPWTAPQPKDTPRTGTAKEAQPRPQGSPQLQSPQDRIAASSAAASSTAARRPRPWTAFWLLLLLLLILFILLWLFSRSRAAQWILRLVGGLVERMLKAWNWLRARLQKAFIPLQTKTVLEQTPIWLKDPFYDVFTHPEVLMTLTRREVILCTYHLFLNLAEISGQARRINQTPQEYADSLEVDTPEARVSLQALAWSYTRAMYGDLAMELPAASKVQATWKRVVEVLVRHISPEELALRKQEFKQRRVA